MVSRESLLRFQEPRFLAALLGLILVATLVVLSATHSEVTLVGNGSARSAATAAPLPESLTPQLARGVGNRPETGARPPVALEAPTSGLEAARTLKHAWVNSLPGDSRETSVLEERTIKREPLAPSPPKAQAASLTPPANIPSPVTKLPRVEVPDVPGPGSPPTLIHTVRRGETVVSIARRYLPQTSLMTVAELEEALRRVNAGKNRYSPGEQVIIPGILTAPIAERPVPVPKNFEVRAIYLTGYTAGSEHGIQLIRRWHDAGGNSIVFDIKDYDGLVNVPFDHSLAPKRHDHPIRNLPKLIQFLHSLDLHAIARITLFRDEHLAKSFPQLAVRSRRTGQAWRENGKLAWTDPSQPEVQEYNLALAKHVAECGADEIQFDYVRFPAEGDQEDARFAFQSEHSAWKRSEVITSFLSRVYAELHPLGVLVSLDVFGVMAWQRPPDLRHTGQDIAAMAESCDVLSPMIYPSHFFGMDGYARPGDSPEHFIGESMDRFEQITLDSQVVLRPWLQAFAWRTRTYSPNYIRTQVRVAKESGGIGYLFWNARNDYAKVFQAMPELSASAGRLPRREQAQDRSHGESQQAVRQPAQWVKY